MFEGLDLWVGIWKDLGFMVSTWMLVWMVYSYEVLLDLWIYGSFVVYTLVWVLRHMCIVVLRSFGVCGKERCN